MPEPLAVASAGEQPRRAHKSQVDSPAFSLQGLGLHEL